MRKFKRVAVLCAAIVVLCAGCSSKPEPADAEFEYVQFPSSAAEDNGGWERLGQSQITVYDEEGNSTVYDVVVNARDAGDIPPVEGSVRLSRVISKGDPYNQEETDRDENCARWVTSRVIVGVMNRDAEMLAECGVENCTSESIDSMFEALKPVCTASTEQVFLSTQAIGTDTIIVNAIAPNFTTSVVVEKDSAGVWKIPYVSGMLEQPVEEEETGPEEAEPVEQSEVEDTLE